MTELTGDKPLKDSVVGMNTGESRALLEKQLFQHRQHLRELADDAAAGDRGRIMVDIAETLLGLEQSKEAWDEARAAFDLLLTVEEWQAAVEACEIMYRAEQEQSIIALAQGVWLGITYPISPQTTVAMLHHVVDETPDDSDGGAVAAAVAHYIVHLRCEGKDEESLSFLTSQILAQVAKRHRGIEDEESINIWMEMLQLNDPKELLPRLSTMLDVIVGDNWWFDRDELRAKLPVN